ncbi:LuxR family transcriptional regulator [Plantactinospora sp. BB1]|uniref:helix-turn-helix transcriptional regulator n=1 Tax=Plantactinospora sp. BB1 TaxID=2071627 RepID=UPI000D177419|nr:SARP family transcriptional regulator [Plantactinospora sp. BB1]
MTPRRRCAPGGSRLPPTPSIPLSTEDDSECHESALQPGRVKVSASRPWGGRADWRTRATPGTAAAGIEPGDRRDGAVPDGGTVTDPDRLVGRDQELGLLTAAVGELARGRGSAVWVEGEPGVGKSALVEAGIAAARGLGCEVLWGTADHLSQRSPLGVMASCLGVRARSPDRRRAEIAEFLLRRGPRLVRDFDVVYAAAAEMLVALVDELCTAAPTVLVIDDLQWADPASVTVWQRLCLAVEQMPLMLVGVCGPVLRRPEVVNVRTVVSRRDHTVITLAPLTETDTTTLVATLVGGWPGPNLARWVAAAMGNPLHLRELVEALLRERMIRVRGDVADLPDDEADRVPVSLADALSGRLSFVPDLAVHALDTAAMLGHEFAVTELATLVREPVSVLSDGLKDAVAAGILVRSGSRMAFRHPLIRQALYERMPVPVRAALHLDAARVLADADGDPLTVAQQLLAADQLGDRWVRGWLVATAPVVAARAPDVAATLLRRELGRPSAAAGDQAPVLAALARILLGMGRHSEAASHARRAIAVLTGPEDRGEMYWVLTRALIGGGRTDEALDALRDVFEQPGQLGSWHPRLLASSAMALRASRGDLVAADAAAVEALHAAELSGDAYAIGYALTDLWLTESVRRRHRSALERVDRALRVLGDEPDHADVRMFALHARVFTLQNLCRWADAEAAERQTRQVAREPGNAMGSATGVTAAVLLYWTGRWDDAIAELHSVDEDGPGITYAGLRERGPTVLRHGVAALLAVRRENPTAASEHFAAGSAFPVETLADRENRDFLLAAQALAAERDGALRLAVSTFGEILDRRPGEMTLIHQWLPDLVRVALAAGDRAAARGAVEASRREAAAEAEPWRAQAARLRCEGLFGDDPALVRAAVAHYRAVGPAVDLAGALEDLAVLLAGRDTAACRAALNEAVELYAGFGATWDIRRTDARLRRRGIRRGVHGTRTSRAVSGWPALTDTERRVALLIAEGRSTPDIASTMFLSRRTVQTHVSRVLAKLELHSRVEIAREVNTLTNIDR